MKPEFRKRLTEQHRQALLAVCEHADFDSEAAFEIDGAILESLPTKFNCDTLAPLTECQQLFLAAWYLDSEINNGGFHQFFCNKGPAIVRAADRFLLANHLHEVRRLLLQSVEALPGETLPRTFAELESMLVDAEDLVDRFGSLDDRYFELQPSTDIRAARLKLVQDRQVEFFS